MSLSYTQQFTHKGQKQYGKTLKTTYTVTYQCISTDVTTTAGDILADSGLPFVIGQVYPDDASVYCISISPNRNENAPKVWTIEFGFGLDEHKGKDPNNNNETPTDPTTWDWDLSISWVKRSVPAVYEAKANPRKVVNSMGDAPIPPKNIDMDDMVISISGYTTGLGLGTLRTYNNTINSAIFWGIEVHHAKITIATEKVKMYGNTYYRKTYKVEENSQGWDLSFLDEGKNSLKDSNGNPVTSSSPPPGAKKCVATDGNGMPCAVVLLNGHGGELAVGADPVIFPAAGAEYQMYKETAFANIGLPDITTL